VTQAVLQLTTAAYAGTGTASAPEVRVVTGSWTEGGVTWATKPAVGPLAAAGGGAWAQNAVFTWDVTGVVGGNGAVSLALLPTSADAANINSREQTSGKPTLTVTTCGLASTATVTPVVTNTPTVTNTPSAGDVSLVAVGDIACSPGKAPTGTSCRQMATSDVALAANPDTVLVLGDNQYDCGTLADFNGSYNPSWGRLKSITHPVLGNHEYNIAGGTSAACSSLSAPNGAEGYWNYFGDAATPRQPGCRSSCQGYYSFDAGGWHIVVLNSMICVPPFNQCGSQTSPQVQWLKSDLAAHQNQCTLAAWHHPLYSTTEKSTQTALLWGALYNAGAEIVLVGHAHRYERYAPMDAAGNANPFGIREFIVGTGGKDAGAVGTSPSPNFELGRGGVNGVLKLDLHANGYDWQFLPAAGSTFSDSGSASCHGAPSASTTGVLASAGPPPMAALVAGLPDGLSSWPFAAGAGVLGARTLRRRQRFQLRFTALIVRLKRAWSRALREFIGPAVRRSLTHR
jgi:hypothetical protein